MARQRPARAGLLPQPLQCAARVPAGGGGTRPADLAAQSGHPAGRRDRPGGIAPGRGGRAGERLCAGHGRDRGAYAQPGPQELGYSLKLGMYGDDWLQRACTAMKGLGALRADEAIYAMADFDADGQPLDGRHRYELRFAPRHAAARAGILVGIAVWRGPLFQRQRDRALRGGDRTPGLRMEADGGLVLPISHARPPQEDNWLACARGAVLSDPCGSTIRPGRSWTASTPSRPCAASTDRSLRMEATHDPYRNRHARP
ncbi:DUF1214 domain-containing protein [Cupriavidus basilensis]